MHIRAITKARPAQAQDLQFALELLNQVISTLSNFIRLIEDVGRLLGVEIPNLFDFLANFKGN